MTEVAACCFYCLFLIFCDSAGWSAFESAERGIEDDGSEASCQADDVVFVMEVTQKGGLCDYIQIRRGDDPEELARVSAARCTVSRAMRTMKSKSHAEWVCAPDRNLYELTSCRINM